MKVKSFKISEGELTVSEGHKVTVAWVAGKSLAEYLECNQKVVFKARYGDGYIQRMTEVHEACVAAVAVDSATSEVVAGAVSGMGTGDGSGAVLETVGGDAPPPPPVKKEHKR